MFPVFYLKVLDFKTQDSKNPHDSPLDGRRLDTGAGGNLITLPDAFKRLSLLKSCLKTRR